MELSLADLVPLWRTIRDQAATAMVTPALDYIGGLELGTTDMRFADEDQIAHFGEATMQTLAQIGMRYDHEHDERATIITTNLPEAVLDARLTERFSSRVAGDHLGYRACVDADLRRAQ